MKYNEKIIAVVVGLLLMSAFWKSSVAEFEKSEPSLNMFMDYGRIVEGDFPTGEADGQILNRTFMFFSQSGAFDQRLKLAVTMGGFLFSPLPEAEVSFSSRLIYPALAIGEASASYLFGDVDEPFAQLKAGFFPIKYNPDVKNLGEYLYRSGAYPTILYSGGWSYLNSAAYMAGGATFRVNTFEGMWTHDFTMTFERDLEPSNNISPAYISTFKSGFFEFGVGLQWAHLIPLKPDTVITPNALKNAYVKEGGLPPEYQQWAGRPLFYNLADTVGDWNMEKDYSHYNYYGPDDPRNDSRVFPDGDPCVTDFNDPCYDDKNVSVTENGIPGQYLDYYTFRGIKAMARTSMDFGALLGLDELTGPGAFKIYSEVALLGLQDQPGLYENKQHRMPIVFGINIPTFKLLDVLSFEIEYWNSPYPNDIENLFLQQRPIPVRQAVEDYAVYDLDGPYYQNCASLDSLNCPVADSIARQYEVDISDFDKDNLKWTLYARRQIFKGMNVTAQVASDHLRHFDIRATGARPSDFPTTRYTKDWYFLFRLEMGI